MHELTPFERRLSERLAFELSAVVRPFDPAVVAAAAIRRDRGMGRRWLLLAAAAALVTLVAGMVAAGWRTQEDPMTSRALPWPLTGVLEPTGALHNGSLWGKPVLLADGRVLVFTINGNQDVVTPQLWDPATGTFDLLRPLERLIEPTTAIVLRDGRVLLLGTGMARIDDRTTAEIFDPATTTFSLLASQPNTIDGAAALLPDGRVLLTGGRGSLEPDQFGLQGITSTAEVFDPSTDQFRLIEPMQRRRLWHDMELLRDGRVLVLGGEYSEGAQVDQAVAEIYDPATGRFNVAPRSDLQTHTFDWHVRRRDRELVFLRQPGWGQFPDRSMPMSIAHYDLETGTESPGATIPASAPMYDVRSPVLLADTRLLLWGSDKATFEMDPELGWHAGGWVGVLDLETGNLSSVAARPAGLGAVVPLRDGGLMLLGGSERGVCDVGGGTTLPCFAPALDVDILR